MIPPPRAHIQSLPCPGDTLRPPQVNNWFLGVFHRNCVSWFMLQIFLKSHKQAASCAPYLFLSGPRPGNSSSQPWLTFGLSWVPPSPAQVEAICRWLCSSCHGTRQNTGGGCTSWEAPRPVQPVVTSYHIEIPLNHLHK